MSNAHNEQKAKKSTITPKPSAARFSQAARNRPLILAALISILIVYLPLAVLLTYLELVRFALLCHDFDGNLTRQCSGLPVILDGGLIVATFIAVWVIVAYLAYAIVKMVRKKT